MITLHCCGEDYYADEMHIGSHIKCRKCGRFLTIEPKTPLSSTASGYPVAAPSETVIRRRLPLLKLVFGGVVLSALVVWISFARFSSNRDEQSTRVPQAQMPMPAKAQPNAPSPSPWVPKRVAVSLPTGTWIIRPRGIAGHGVLKIENGSELDAVVKLVLWIPGEMLFGCCTSVRTNRHLCEGLPQEAICFASLWVLTGMRTPGSSVGT